METLVVDMATMTLKEAEMASETDSEVCAVLGFVGRCSICTLELYW